MILAPVIHLGDGSEHGTVQVYSMHRPASLPADNSVVLTCDIAFDGYFAARPHGHMGFMLRADPEGLPGGSRAGQYRGHGVIIGNVHRTEANQAPPWMPCAMLETWGVGVVPDTHEYIHPASGSPRLRDFWQYKLMIVSTVIGGDAYRRYALRELVSNEGGQYRTLIDTGDVHDNNWGLPRWSDRLAVFDAHGAGAPYAIRIERLCVAWGEPLVQLPDLTGLPWARP